MANGLMVTMYKLQKLADKLNKELVIVKSSWDGLLPALKSGKIDGIIAGMSPTAERREQIAFSEPYYTSNLVMMVKSGGPFAQASSLADFSGAKLPLSWELSTIT